MADNVIANTSDDGGATFATDEDTSTSPARHFPGTKIMLGANGTFTAYWDGTVDLGATDNAVLDAIAASVAGTLTVDGSGVTQPVSGTVTANLSATDNAVLDTIDAVLDTINAKLVTGTVIGDVNLGATDNAVLDAIAASVAGTLTVDGSGATQPVSGTVTANLSATDNAVLDAIAASVAGTLTVDGSGATQPVSGTVTANLSATDNAVLDSIATPVQTISSTPLQRVAIFDDSDSQITTFGGGTQYTEDGVATANPVGTAQILIAETTPALEVAEDDYVARRATRYGAAYTQILDSSGNFVDSFGGSGGTAAADDADFVAGTTQGTPGMGVYESSPSSVTDGDLGTFGITASREIKVDITSNTAGVGGGTAYIQDQGVTDPATAPTYLMARDDTLATQESADNDWTVPRANARGAQWVEVDPTNALDVSAATVTVDGTVTANLSATDNAVLDTIDAVLDAINAKLVTGTVIGDVNLGATDNAVLDAIAASVAGTLTVGSHAVTNAGTFAVQVEGSVAHDVAASGNDPVLAAARASNSVENLSQVASLDSTYLTADLNGCLVTRPHTTQEEIKSERVANTDGASTALTTFDAGGAGVHNYLTTIVAHNSSGTDGYVDIRDGTAGSVLMTIPLPTTGGAVINLPVPLKGSANTAIAFDVSAALSTIYLSFVGYQAQG